MSCALFILLYSFVAYTEALTGTGRPIAYRLF